MAEPGAEGYPDNRPAQLPSWITHDVQLRWQAPWNADILIGVRILTDREPVIDPYDASGYAYQQLYDGRGRTPYLRYQQTW